MEKASFDDKTKGNYGGNYIGEVVRSKYRMEGRIEDIQLTHTLKNGWTLFITSRGREPKSTEEFLQYATDELGARLPPLEENEKFFYDPKTYTLYKVVSDQ